MGLHMKHRAQSRNCMALEALPPLLSFSSHLGNAARVVAPPDLERPCNRRGVGIFRVLVLSLLSFPPRTRRFELRIMRSVKRRRPGQRPLGRSVKLFLRLLVVSRPLSPLCACALGSVLPSHSLLANRKRPPLVARGSKQSDGIPRRPRAVIILHRSLQAAAATRTTRTERNASIRLTATTS